jgi:hypothetical protein
VDEKSVQEFALIPELASPAVLPGFEQSRGEIGAACSDAINSAQKAILIDQFMRMLLKSDTSSRISSFSATALSCLFTYVLIEVWQLGDGVSIRHPY